MAKSRARRRPLSRDSVLAAALDVVDRDGLDALTMRSLGNELAVEAMSLYHHVGSKSDVLDGLVDLVLRSVDLPDPGLEWSEWSRRFARVYRRIGAEHPHVFPLIALRPLATANAFRPVELGLEVFARAGFGELHALAAFQTLADFISGFALEELAAAGGEGSPVIETLDATEFPRLRRFIGRPMKRDVAFERGLDIIIDGIAVQLEGQGATPR